MLSRTAEALFALGRSVERADATARLLEARLPALAAEPWSPRAGADLLALVGAPVAESADRARVLALLAYDPASPPSLAAALTAAREHAGRARSAVPAQVRAALDAAHAALPPGRWRAASLEAYLAWVRERAATVTGLVDAAMSRDEGWLFLVLGRSVERADTTAVMVASTCSRTGPASPWPALLRACGADEALRRSSWGLDDDAAAAGFLLLDRLFPRSVVHALAQAERCLGDLVPSEPGSSGQRPGVGDDAQRLLGRARAELEYRPLAEVVADLPAHTGRVRRATAAASEALARRCFAGAPALAWTPTVLGRTG